MLYCSILLSYYKYDIIKPTGGRLEVVKIENVIPGSTAAKAGLNKKDKIISINGQEIRDYIDYLYQISEPVIKLKILKNNGKQINIELERQLGEELGIEFKEIVFDGLKQCKNNCIFCFVKQQPKNMRNSLNQKDDDYRFSFLQGSFVTLTNLEKNEIKRIIEKHLSPINISVHTTNPELRVKMMKNPKAAEIMRLLKLFKKNAIDFHTQIVLCPEYNDNKELDRSIKDLIDLYPELLSIGIVPVGLTKYREGLANLRTMTSKEKKETLNQIKKWQQKSINKYGENFIYASDEFYLSTDSKLPEYDEYNGFPQLENGIGMTTLMNREIKKIEIPKNLNKKQRVAVITSELGEKALENFKNKFKRISNLKIDINPVKNKFFGETVTVTGLLTAQDLREEILTYDSSDYDYIFISNLVLNDQDKFLDEITKKEFLHKLPGYKLKFIDNFKEFLEVIENG